MVSDELPRDAKLAKVISEDGTKHEITATAKVPCRTHIIDGLLQATQQMDFVVQEWTCSCGRSWDFDKRDKAVEHLNSITTDTSPNGESESNE